MIDDHAHPFPTAFAPLDLSRISLGAAAGTSGDRRLWVELLTTRLASLLGVGADEALDAREEAARADWAGYVRTLLDDADVEGLVVDPGVSVAGGGSGAELAALTGRPVWELARVDPLVDDLIGKGATAGEVVDAVETFLTAAAAEVVGFKTILAYRTGLAVDPDADVRRADASLGDGAGGPVRRRGKALRDLVMRVMLERAADHGLPVQVHTGFGDSDIRLGEANPLLLEDLLRSPAGRRATVVLIHGAYPWHEELAYLATVHPNVFAEVSLFNLFAPLRVADRLGRMLELAPPDKLLAGSDGHLAPETHWFACRVLQEALAAAGREVEAAGARPQWFTAARRAVLAENARRVYGLVP